MFNLLTAEKIKVWKSRKMWVSLGLMVVLPLFYSWNEWYMHTKYGNELNQATDTVINGATGILMVEKMAAWILLAFAAFACFYIGEEFQNGTIRNTLSLGRNRMTYYVSKLLVTLLITTLGVVLITGLAMIAYTLAFGFGEVEGIKNYGNYVLKVFPVLLLLILATLSVPVALTFITRSTSVSLLLSLYHGNGLRSRCFRKNQRLGISNGVVYGNVAHVYGLCATSNLFASTENDSGQSSNNRGIISSRNVYFPKI